MTREFTAGHLVRVGDHRMQAAWIRTKETSGETSSWTIVCCKVQKPKNMESWCPRGRQSVSTPGETGNHLFSAIVVLSRTAATVMVCNHSDSGSFHPSQMTDTPSQTHPEIAHCHLIRHLIQASWHHKSVITKEKVLVLEIPPHPPRKSLQSDRGLAVVA